MDLSEKELSNLAVSAFEQFWFLWGSRDDACKAQLIEMVSDDFSGFGTNIHEAWASKQDLQTQIDTEWNQVPVPYQFKTSQVKANILGADTILITGLVHLCVRIRDLDITLEDLRNSQIYTLKDGDLKLSHWHCSTRDAGIDGEVIPGSFESRSFEETSVLFIDFIGYTNISKTLPTKKLVKELKDIYAAYDAIMESEELEPLQVTGDGYLAICGLPKTKEDHAVRAINAAGKVLDYLEERNRNSGVKWHARIGIHSGPVRAGIIGRRKFSLNIFGDTVNYACRLEQHSEAGRINISAYTYDLVKNDYDCEYRGQIDAKGIGAIDMYFVKT